MSRRQPPVETRRHLTSEGLPRRWRLTRGSALLAVLKSGKRHRTPRFDVTWRSNEEGHPRLGVIVPRYGHTAVARNRVRRRLREYARSRILPELSSLDIVVRARPEAYDSPWTEIARDFDRWVQSYSA